MDKIAFLNFSFLALTRIGAILLIILLLRKYFARIATKFFFTFFKKFSNNEHQLKFKEILQKPIQSIIVCFLFFLAFNQVSERLEKVVIFERHHQSSSEINKILKSSFSLTELIDHIFLFGFIFYTSLLIARCFKFAFYIWIAKAKSNNDIERQQLLPLLQDVITVLVWCFSFFTILGLVFHVNVTALIAGLGFGGVAVAFAAKESLENLIASFMIMIDKPFTLGDYIKVNGVEGYSEHIGFRSSRIRSLDGTIITMPNKDLISNSLENFTKRDYVRIKQKISAQYGLSIEELSILAEELKKCLLSIPEINNEKVPIIYIDSLTTTIEISITYFINYPAIASVEYVKQAANIAIYDTMNKHGKGFGFPIYQGLIK